MTVKTAADVGLFTAKLGEDCCTTSLVAVRKKYQRQDRQIAQEPRSLCHWHCHLHSHRCRPHSASPSSSSRVFNTSFLLVGCPPLASYLVALPLHRFASTSICFVLLLVCPSVAPSLHCFAPASLHLCISVSASLRLYVVSFLHISAAPSMRRFVPSSLHPFVSASLLFCIVSPLHLSVSSSTCPFVASPLRFFLSLRRSLSLRRFVASSLRRFVSVLASFRDATTTQRRRNDDATAAPTNSTH